MAKKTIFLGEDIYDGWNEKSYLSLIAEMEQKLSKTPYQPDAPIEHLNILYQLCCLYRKTNKNKKLNELYNHIESLYSIDTEYHEEIAVVRAMTELRIHYGEERLDKERELLQFCTKYAIKNNNYLFLSDLTNKWGGYFSSIGHEDLSILFYGICLNLTYHFRNKFKERTYIDQLFYPISNIILRHDNSEEEKKLEYDLFTCNDIDLSTRVFFGIRKQFDCWANGEEFDQTLFNDLYIKLFGDKNCKSTNDILLEKYYSEDETEIDSYYNDNKSDFAPTDMILYAMLSNRENRERADILMKNINKYNFSKNAPYIHQYLYLLEEEEKERLCLLFLNDVRHADHMLRYPELEGYIDYIKENDSIFDTKSVRKILLEKSGSNGIYEYAWNLLNLLLDYHSLSSGTKWIEKAIHSIGLKDKKLKSRIVNTITKVFDESCKFSKKFNAFEENLKICSSFTKKANLDNTDLQEESFLRKTMYNLIEDYKKNKSQRIFSRMSYSSDNSIPKSSILTDKDIEEVEEALQKEMEEERQREMEEERQKEIEEERQKERLNNPNYGVLIRKMRERGWVINERDLNINILYATKNDLSYILYLFYDKEDAWLADEEDFYGEEPLWFSEKSHLVSPVYRLHQQQAINNSSSLMLVLFPPTYIINADDMKDAIDDAKENNKKHAWQDVVIVKYQSLIDDLNRDGELPLETDYDVIGSSRFQYTSKKYYFTADQAKQAASDEIQRNNPENQIKDNKAKEIIENKDEVQKTLNDPWDLKQVYRVYKNAPYHYNQSNNEQEAVSESDNTLDEKKTYDLEKMGLFQVLSAFLKLLADDVETNLLSRHLEEATLALYFKKTSVKFKLTTGWNYERREIVLKHFVIENFNDDRMAFISRIGIGKGYLDDNYLYFRGNVVSEMCEVVVKIRNSYENFSYFKQDNEHKSDSLQHIESIFRNSLIKTTFKKEGEVPNLYHEYLQEDWEKGISLVSAPILADAVRRLAEKTAKTAIMSRNMSHNLGSHVMAYLKRDLASVGDIIQKGVLRDFYPLPENFGDKGGELSNATELLQNIEKYTKEVEMPFLVGLGRFISYLQERQDFIATISTFYIPYFSIVNFKDDIYDAINPDYRYLRHSDRRGNRPENILMKYIALSEGLSRNGKQLGKRTNDIVIRFRNFNGINDYLLQKQRGKVQPNGPGHMDLCDMRKYSFYLPGGIVGRQALFTILENLIRNSAKHGFWRKKRNLIFTFDIHKGRELTTNHASSELYNFLLQEPGWEHLFQSTNNKLDKFYIITLTDNLDINDNNYYALKESINEKYVGDDTGQMINKHKGIKEIRISAAWMRGIVDDLKVPDGEPPVITVRRVGLSLQYIFCVLAPKKVLMLVDSDDKEKLLTLRQAVSKWEGWYVGDYYNYKRSHDKSYDIIVVETESSAKTVRPFSSDHVVVSDTLFGRVCSDSAVESELLNDLYRQLYHVSKDDDLLLISDGKTNKSDSKHIKVVSSDALVKGANYLYGYRTHHQDIQEFADFMEGDLSKTMLSVEGITGNNSTDRLIRNEKLDDIWYYKHLHALRTKVAIFDERLFSKITGLDDDDLLDEKQFKTGAREAIAHVQKRIWYFNIIYDEAHGRFEIFGYQDFTKDEQGNYNSRITKIAEILPTTLKLNEFGIVPSIEVYLFNNSYKNFAYYISIHQGLMDKIYDAFKLKEIDSYSEEVRKDADKRDNAMKIAMCSVSARLYNAFHELEKDETDDFEILLNNFLYGVGYEEQRFRSGFCFHSGRSKPSEFDMPQKQPFIQYAAIENAVYDCKYSLVELLKSARYEPNE